MVARSSRPEGGQTLLGAPTPGYRWFVVSCQLITASCTTGWLDWVHGELWVLPDGLVRLRTSLSTTLMHQNQQTVPDEAERVELSNESIDFMISTKRRLWIPSDKIKSAHFHIGRTTGRVNLRMKDAAKIKLLWLRSDRSEGPLTAALAAWRVPISGLR